MEKERFPMKKEPLFSFDFIKSITPPMKAKKKAA